MTFRIPSLAQKNSGNITYNDHQVELSPSGRQVNFGIDYVTQFENDFILGLKHTVIKDLDHNSEAGLNNTFTITGSIKF
jgi:ABC-type branched-subunit amino acid transport system ATPase component